MTSITLGKDLEGAFVELTEIVRSMHLHIIGGTRRGKSTLMRSMILEDVKAGHGVCVIDPHGSLINRVLCDLAETKHPYGSSWPISLIEPGRPDYTAVLNPFREQTDNSTAAARIISAILSAWGEFDPSKTPRLARVLSLMCSTLLNKGMPLSDALILLHNPDVRKQIVDTLDDPDLKEGWAFLANGKESVFREYVESTVSRLHPFISSASVRRMFGMTGMGLDLKSLIDKRSIILLNLAQSASFDQESGKLVGSLFINEIRQASMLRPIDGLKKPRPFYLYIDECALFLTQDIISALDECSKFGLHLILAHQRFAQLEQKGEEVLSAVLDIQNRIVFGGSHVDDLDALSKELFTGTIRLDEYIEGTQEPTPIGQKEEELVSKSIGIGLTDAEGQAIGRGVVNSESKGKGLSGSASRNPIQKTITDGGEEEPTNPASYTFGANISRSNGIAKALSNSVSDIRTYSQSRSETVTVGKRQIPVWGLSKGARMQLEEQWELRRGWLKTVPKYHAWTSLVNLPPRLFPVKAVADPQEEEAQAFQQRGYERYRKKVFEQMIERGEALVSAEIDIAITERQQALRGVNLRALDDEPESYRI